MDLIAGLITAIFLFVLFFVSEKIKVYKKFSTAVFGGLMVFAVITKKISGWDEKAVLVVVLGLLIFAVNLKITSSATASSPAIELFCISVIYVSHSGIKEVAL